MKQQKRKRSFFQTVRRLLFHNFWLKMLSLLLAIIIYFTMRSGFGVVGKDDPKGGREEPKRDSKEQTAHADR